MISLLKGAWSWVSEQKQGRVLMIGLENSGKTVKSISELVRIYKETKGQG